MDLLHVSFGDVGAEFLDLAGGGLQTGHAVAELFINSLAFFYAHRVEAGDGLLDSGKDSRFEISIERHGRSGECTRQLENGVQVRAGTDGEFSFGFAEGLDVSANQLFVQGKSRRRGAVD